VPLTASFGRIEKKLPDGVAGLPEYIEKLPNCRYLIVKALKLCRIRNVKSCGISFDEVGIYMVAFLSILWIWRFIHDGIDRIIVSKGIFFTPPVPGIR
jgi:hypothetical protein